MIGLRENECAIFVADDNVGFAVGVNVGREDLRADAGVIVNKMRNEFGGVVLSAFQLKPIEQRGTVRIGIPFVAMGPSSCQ